MKKKILYTLISLLIIFSPLNSFAKDNDDLKVNGNIVIRSEIDARDFNNNTSPLFFTSMRTSLSAEKSFFDKYKFFVQIRDSRMMGEEKDTLSNSFNLGLHQAYAEFTDFLFDGFSTKIGRFESVYGTQRFIGGVNWNYIGRSFDGVKLSYFNKDIFKLKADVFGFIHNTSSPYIGSPNSKIYKETSPLNYDLYGFWLNFDFNDYNKLDLFTLYQRDARQTKININDLNLTTLGINYKANYGNFSSILEGAYQVGTTKELTNNSYLGSAQIFYSIEDFKFGLGTDILSGNNINSKNTANTFIISFGSGHSFYGLMDYFSNIPVNTMNLGLNDYYFNTSWKPKFLPINFSLEGHSFNSNQLSSDNKNNFGQEIDFTINYPIDINKFKNTISLGASIFYPGDLMKKDALFGKDANDNAIWSYLMLVSNF